MFIGRGGPPAAAVRGEIRSLLSKRLMPPRIERVPFQYRRCLIIAVSTAIGGAFLLVAVSEAGHVLGGGGDRGSPTVLALRAPRLVVLKSRRALHLFEGERLIRTYPIDLGVDPHGPKLRDGDGRTPEGSYRVAAKNAQSPYHRFVGINYPNAEDVARGLGRGLLSPGQAASIVDALRNGRCPDLTTALGGGIGIHGGRAGCDWTAGCMALSDEHVEELFAVLRIGDPVEILP